MGEMTISIPEVLGWLIVLSVFSFHNSELDASLCLIKDFDLRASLLTISLTGMKTLLFIFVLIVLVSISYYVKRLLGKKLVVKAYGLWSNNIVAMVMLILAVFSSMAVLPYYGICLIIDAAFYLICLTSIKTDNK